MHADGKSTLALVLKWNSGKVNSKTYQGTNIGPGEDNDEDIEHESDQ